MSSPWEKVTVPEPVNLQDVILEELNKSYQEKEDRKYGVFAFSLNEEIEIQKGSLRNKERLRYDEEIAKMLQQQCNKEYCDISRQLDGEFNSALKVSLALHDKQTPMNLDYDSDCEYEELEDIRDKNEWDKLSTALEKFDPVPAYNTIYDSRNFVTNNNTLPLNNETICKIISFPWTIVPGANIEIKLRPKRTYWTYGYFVSATEKEEIPFDFGVDDQTKILLYKMIKDKFIKHIYGMISLTEDALILYAKTNPQYQKGSLPTDCCLKIFKTTFGECKRKDRFLKDNYIFKDMWGKSGEVDMVKTACFLAQKEMHILKRLKKADIPCPEVLALKRNILVMSYLNKSEDSKLPAPTLRDSNLDQTELARAHEQIIHSMNVMYNECNLIHGDLSATNIFWYHNECNIIDVSQFVGRTHENALYLLYNDCERVSEFFMQNSVPVVPKPQQLFRNITGYDPRNRFTWVEYQKFLKIKSFQL